MELYVGGTAQGKLTYVANKMGRPVEQIQIVDGRDCTLELSDLVEVEVKVEVLNHLHLLTKRWLEAGKEASELVSQIQQLNQISPNLLLICDEVGAGVVPMKREERDYRETVGRVCCELAKQASCVERIVCGIGVRIK